MTIYNQEKYIESLWDWGFLNTCFSSNIRVSDLDGIVERNGKFLVIEGKSDGVPIPHGQKVMFKQMAKTGLFTIIVIWGKPNKLKEPCVPTRIIQIDKDYPDPNNPKEIDILKGHPHLSIKLLVKEWFRKTSKSTV